MQRYLPFSSCIFNRLPPIHQTAHPDRRAVAQSAEWCIGAVLSPVASHAKLHLLRVPAHAFSGGEDGEHTLGSSQTWHKRDTGRTRTALLEGGASSDQVLTPS